MSLGVFQGGIWLDAWNMFQLCPLSFVLFVNNICKNIGHALKSANNWLNATTFRHKIQSNAQLQFSQQKKLSSEQSTGETILGKLGLWTENLHLLLSEYF